MNTPSYTIDDDPLCDIIVSNIWEDENGLVEWDDPLCSLDDLYLCRDSIPNYDVEFTFDAWKYFERGRDRSLFMLPCYLKIQATDVGVMDTGVSPSTCYWAPSSAHLQPRR
jgi:hypothetical protein